MTEAEILDGVLQAEGKFRAAVKRPDGTWDPDTMRGITAPVAQQWFGLAHLPGPVELQGLVTAEVARAIYRRRYIDGPGFTAANIPYAPLRHQLIDFGINSGPPRAIRWLQRVLRLPPAAVTGRMDATTIHALQAISFDGRTDTWLAIVNDALVAARTYMVDQATDQGSMRKADEEGVESRALRFFLAKPAAREGG